MRPPSLASAVDLAPVIEPRFRALAQHSRAGAFLTACPLPDVGVPQLVCDQGKRALALILAFFEPAAAQRSGISDRAMVSPEATVDASSWIGPFCYVEAGVSIGARVRVGPMSCIYEGSSIAEDCLIGAGAVVGPDCHVGARSRVGPGAVIGHDGFGYYAQGDQGWGRIPSLGGVSVGADCEIGANACIDRATFGQTTIGAGSKLDNLVQVGHNASVGEHALVCAQTGLAGSAMVGDQTQLGGQVGVADHRQVGSCARVGAKSGVSRDVPDGVTVSGYPAQDHRDWLRMCALQKQLRCMQRELRQLREQVRLLRANEAKR